MPRKDKGRNGGDRPTPSTTVITNSISIKAWRLTYSLEEARQQYADRRQLMRQAAVCVVLALLRLVGVRHA